MWSPASELLVGIVTLFVSFEAILWLISTLGVPLFLAGFFCSHYSSTFMQITGCCCLLFFVFGDLWSNCGWLRRIQFCVWSYMNELKNAPFLPLLWIKVCKICGEGSYRCVIQCGCEIGWKLSERENFTFYQCEVKVYWL